MILGMPLLHTEVVGMSSLAAARRTFAADGILPKMTRQNESYAETTSARH